MTMTLLKSLSGRRPNGSFPSVHDDKDGMDPSITTTTRRKRKVHGNENLRHNKLTSTSCSHNNNSNNSVLHTRVRSIRNLVRRRTVHPSHKSFASLSSPKSSSTTSYYYADPSFGMGDNDDNVYDESSMPLMKFAAQTSSRNMFVLVE